MPAKNSRTYAFQNQNRSFVKSSRPKMSRWRSLARLAVGGLILGAEDLMDRLEIWEHIATSESIETVQAETLYQSEADQSLSSSKPFIQPEVDSYDARHVLIGLVFDSQEKLERGLATLGRIERRTSRSFLSPFSKLQKSRLFRPFYNRFERLVSRGEAEVARWAELGKMEEHHSRKLAMTATTSTVDSSIGYLAHNEELQELVQSQSAGLAMEILEEIRERTISADTFLEGVTRSMMRRVPRKSLPGPPPEVRLRAARLHPPEDD